MHGYRIRNSGGGGENFVHSGGAACGDLGLGKRVVVEADFIVGDVGIAIARPLGSTEPVVYIFDLIEPEGQVCAADEGGVPIPRNPPAGGGIGADARLIGADKVVLGVRGDGDADVGLILGAAIDPAGKARSVQKPFA